MIHVYLFATSDPRLPSWQLLIIDFVFGNWQSHRKRAVNSRDKQFRKENTPHLCSFLTAYHINTNKEEITLSL